MNIKCLTAFAAILLVVANGRGQGFVNLDFEAANVSAFPPGTVPRGLGLPGWAAYISGTPQTTILYDNATLGEAAIALQGPNGFFQPIQGQYFVLLEATFFASDTNSAAIGQTGQVPLTAQSLVFWGNTSVSGVANNMEVTFNGSLVPYAAIGSGNNYTIYGANVSGFAGQTGELRFTAFNNTRAEIDNMQFSSLPVPEPSGLALVVLAAALFGLRRWENQSKSVSASLSPCMHHAH